MAKRPVITKAMADQAAAVLAEQVDPDHEPTKQDSARRGAADIILRHWGTQERYALDVQTPAEYARAVRNSPNTRAAELDRLTEAQAEALQQQMTGDYPGKAS